MSQYTYISPELKKISEDYQIAMINKLNTPTYGFDTFDQSLNTVTTGIQAFSSLASIYTGLEQLDLAKEQREMEKRKFELAEQNLERVTKVIGNLTANFG